MKARQIEGSLAVAEVVALCRPQVICAYPITPQTHIVEGLARMVAGGKLKSEYVLVESEFAAASVVLGACATGARTYTATSSQGLLLMTEVIFNIAGMRLPVVMTVANRAVSAPISIWNDQQDSMSLRDCGWVQLYAEDVQEACDMQIQAYRIAEELNLPVIVCMDGYILTHATERVEIPSQEEVDKFLPPYEPRFYLTPGDPITLGAMAGPDAYMEIRFLLHNAMQAAGASVTRIAHEFGDHFGRYRGSLVEGYGLEGAEVILVSLGSVLGTIRDAVDQIREEEGLPVGVLKVRCNRPFPRGSLYETLRSARAVGIIEKDVSLGLEGILCSEIRSAFCGSAETPKISSFIAGLGGRDITVENIKGVARTLYHDDTCRVEFINLDRDMLKRVHEVEDQDGG